MKLDEELSEEELIALRLILTKIRELKAEESRKAKLTAQGDLRGSLISFPDGKPVEKTTPAEIHPVG